MTDSHAVGTNVEQAQGEACRCDPRTWAYPDNVPAICDEYVGRGCLRGDGNHEDGMCATCDHNEECHAD